MKIAIATGGTGGHVMPALALAKELENRGFSPHFLLPLRDEAKPWRELIHWDVDTFPLYPPSSWRFLSHFFVAWKKLNQWFDQYRPCGLLVFGSYPSLLPSLVARWRGVPFVCFEQNAYPGRAIRWLSLLAEATVLPWEEARSHLPFARTLEVLGNPVRPLERLNKEKARTQLGLFPQKTTVTVLGGSQGASSLNQAVLSLLPCLKAYPLQWIHITGLKDWQKVQRKYSQEGIPAAVFPFVEDMALVYSATDVLLSRSGGSTIFEALSFGLPMVLVPYPYAKDDHQVANAKAVEKAGAGICLLEGESSFQKKLLQAMGKLLDPSLRRSMAERAKSLAKPKCSLFCAQLVERIVKRKAA